MGNKGHRRYAWIFLALGFAAVLFTKSDTVAIGLLLMATVNNVAADILTAVKKGQDA